MQIVFQAPASSLDPRQKAGDIVGEYLNIHAKLSKQELRERVTQLFQKVGLRPAQMENYPHEFPAAYASGWASRGRHRLTRKSSSATRPCRRLTSPFRLRSSTCCAISRTNSICPTFIAHDLAVVEHISHRVAVMYLGRIVELADKRELFGNPLHPYTESLLAAVPVPDPTVERNRTLVQGDVASPINRPSGCHFHPRCPYAIGRCRVESPPLLELKPGHVVSCHLPRPATPNK